MVINSKNIQIILASDISFDENALELGQRTLTCMIYLNDVESGGETEFTKLGLIIKPKKGTIVIWNNLNEDGTGNEYTT